MSGPLSWPDETEGSSGPKERPRNIRLASILTYIGGAVSLVLAFGAYASYRQLGDTPLEERRERAREVLERSDRPAGQQEVDDYLELMSDSILGIGVFLVVAAAVWVFIGLMIARGKAWTRLTASALAFCNLPFIFITGQMTTYIGIASVVLGIVAAGLLWSRESREWLGAASFRV